MKLVMNGSLYQGSKPVTVVAGGEKTALAEAEVEYHEHTLAYDLGEVSGCFAFERSRSHVFS